jgi:acyl transferase domain-containing protein/cation diffusion facilitator CzcD-associated flavoprotein CzcO/enoyl-CoA hydratase/carnithine racemase/aryl carrier-like protein
MTGPVAIIGVGMRLPGADNLDAFWAHLAAGRSLITEVPARRWSTREFRGNPATGHKTNSIWGGFVADADAFDADFFNISPREAAWMDPQQRFALEMAWHAIEDAGLCASALAGSRTGVYMGVCHWDYAELIQKHLARVEAHTPTGIAFSVIANRVSHAFDFRGPSVTNDTACAASLVAINDAVRDLDRGVCDLALAGGVNLAWSPDHFIAFAKSGMLSRDGLAKAFDARADGYVRGEGGAVLLLKPLARAEQDGDPIHAVIAGIGTNHGGRTSSLTVTNPNAQADLIADVHRRAGVAPQSVSYVEAHGPGTPLGDPIEIAGLKTAFRVRAAETGVELEAGSCGIGSVKTNIGHLEGAAGVAGVVKVLAALRHEALPPNVGFETLNPLIDFAGSPFRIQSDMTAWPRVAGHPRRAGVSSFGFGGTNAHVVIEDAKRPSRRASSANGRIVFPLSARTDDALKRYAADLRDFILQRPNVDFADVALTFQTAREPMACRVAFVVEDCAGLAAALSTFIAGTSDERVRLPGGEIASEDPWRGADLWVAGGEVIFDVPEGARRLHAPLYPFMRERHWFDTAFGSKDAEPVAHPFLHRNVSTFDAIAYRSRFSGSEFFFAEHVVQGRTILPGVVALEMARAAFASAASAVRPLRMTDVVWRRAIVAGEGPVDVDMRLSRSGEGADFTVATQDSEGASATSVQGRIEPAEASATRHDLAALKARASEMIDPLTCYERLSARGITHGPSFQALAPVHRGDGFVLAELRLARRLAGSLGELPLHPVLLDAAIQAWVALDADAPKGAGVPFACREVIVARACEARMWAYVRPCVRSRRDAGASGAVLHLDIDLTDRDGNVCVAFREVALRLVGDAAHRVTDADRPALDEGSSTRLVLARGIWQERPAQKVGGPARKIDVDLFVSGELSGFQGLLAQRMGLKVHVLPLRDESDDADTAGRWWRAIHAHLAAAMASGLKESRKIVIVVPDALPAYLSAPLVGLLRTAALENPKLCGVVVRVDGAQDAAGLAGIVAAEAACSDTFVEVRYSRDGERCVWQPEPVDDPVSERSALQLDPDGAYWITGGLGGLGLLFAGGLVARGARRIVLSGRSGSVSGPQAERIEALAQRGADVRVIPCDVACREDVAGLVANVERTFAPLRGVIHGAGVLDDAFIFGGDADRADKVLRPKIDGTLIVDAATAHIDLQFFVLCSSVASVFGNAGQGAYAGANAFMDAFAEHRAEAMLRGERRGVTRAIAWPLWAEGGMSVAPPFVEALRRRFGTEPLPSDVGLDALWRLLSLPDATRSVVLHGDPTRIGPLLEEAAAPETPPADADRAVLPDADLVARTIAHLKELLSDATQIDAARIRAETALVEYGLDSIIIVDVTARLESVLGPLSKTLFFEYVTLASLAAHLVEEHGAALARALPGAAAPMQVAALQKRDDVKREAPQENLASADHDDTHDIAIIGISLRVAKAADKDAFWEMLSKGLHGVGPVPRERWDHEAIYHPDRDVLGKTVVKTGAFLDDIDAFDPRYFRISQAEAELMSPEVRLFLEASVEAFEDAGYSRETLQTKMGGDVAVLVGSMTNEYDYFGFESMLSGGARASGSYTGTLPNMVSYFYGLTGPSYFLDTMCSAAATCMHEAVHMLRAGRCKMALAGGVSLLLHPQKLIAVSQEHFTSKTADVVRGYGVGADGTILGEGVGAVVLKRRADAIRDGDHIYGVIKGTAVTNAGVRNGFTVPSPAQQAAAVSGAIDDAGIDPRTIGYVEGHGSGTALGDPIEVRALTQAYRAHTADTQFCPIGTVKSNVAHLLAAAAVAGVAKVLMQMKHGQLAPSLHAETLNPDIPFATTPFYVQRALAPWPRVAGPDGRALPRRAGVTSIGAGGMNAHLIIEEHIPGSRMPHPGGAEVCVFSAMTEAALLRLVARMRDFIASAPEPALADIAFTLQTGRTELPCRLAVVAEGCDDLVVKLAAFLAKPASGSRVWYTPSTLDREPRFDTVRVAADTGARALDRVATAWVDGTGIDWEAHHAGRRPYRVSLPTYPFERVRCWYPARADAPSVVRPLGARALSDGLYTELKADPRQPARSAGEGQLASALTELAADLLKFDRGTLSARTSFYDLGFDSISLTRFAALIGERFGVPVSPAIFFDCEHIEALAQHLASRGAGGASEVAVLPGAGIASQDERSPGRKSGGMSIAIVGMAARLPGAESVDDFIERLLAGEDLTSPFPHHRYTGAYADRLKQASFAKRGGFLADVDRFDAAFFRISPVEAERLDPQQRLMLETSWRALEQAGYRPEDLPRDTGVFVGVSGRDYASLLEAHAIAHDGFAATGNSLAMVANRISHVLDVRGPSEAIDTACSSSLVALVRAADALAAGRCAMALVGGVNLTLAVEGFEGPHLAGMLSPDGRCKTFSVDANGYARGEGVVALLLKPLTNAEADGDSIFGVLVGGAVNHGGRAGALTAPNAKAQAELIEQAMAGIDPATIGFIEAHGTGTALGDPVEVAALGAAYRKLAGDGGVLPPIGLGAVKSNIGHLEAAAGLAGVVKVLGAMERGIMPPTLHCRALNPHVELSGTPFLIVREPTPWPRRVDAQGSELPKRAGVSSFGFGGVNAHVVVEAYAGGRNRRPPLAARAFADTRFWIPGQKIGAASPEASHPEDEVVLHVPRWIEAALSQPRRDAPRRRLVLSCAVDVSETAGCRVIECMPATGDVAARYAASAGVLLETLQSELARRDAAPLFIQLVHALEDDGPLFAGLGALLDTARAECAHLTCQVVGVSAGLAPGAVAALLDAEALQSVYRRVRIERDRRLVLTWEESPHAPLARPAWRDGGVYLITGGLGGLGRLLAFDIAARANAPVLVLTGASPLDPERQSLLDALQKAGARARYHQVDVCDADAVVELVAETVRCEGALNGVFHCAGVLRDRTLLNKTRADLYAVLAPKVTGALALAEACKGHSLDCFVLFSSLAGAFGNAGQGDYAAANAFLDALAHTLRGELPAVSVNWPLWRDGGMRIDDAGQSALFAAMGQRPLSSDDGLAALGAALAMDESQVAVVAGDARRIRTYFEAAALAGACTDIAATDVAAASVPARPVSRRLVERTEEALRHLLSRVSGVAAASIAADTPLDAYGIDSLMITRLNRELGDMFGPLSAALLFEHRTLAALARYLTDQHPDGCRRFTGEEAVETEIPAAPGAACDARPDVRLRTSPERSPATEREPIAIIGMSGRYPGAEDLDAFWDNLAAGRDLVGEVPQDRWPLAGFFEPDVETAVARGQSYAKWGGFLDGFAEFDALLFKISPRDAASMDPQERLFLMAAWAACEDGGYSRARLASRHRSRVGVYVGVTKTGFALHGPFAGAGGALVRPTTSFAGIANRVSHVLDLSGPSVPVDTMCSSSLTAIHVGCEALRAGTCEMALAGGVNLYLHPSNFAELSAARMLSPDGTCKSFGAGANGFVPGEGVGCLLLKPLSRALADGDRIHAVIRGTAVNHGGRTNGYTVPNPAAQRDVIRAALDAAGLDARDVTCIEAHGTGTDLGDPIEVEGLAQAFGMDTAERGFCALGSVKSNIGHLEAAAGIAGLTKAVLQMKHGLIAPTLHAAEVNPKLDLDATPFRLQTSLGPWNGPRIAGISSFGAGGANAHVLVEEWRHDEGLQTCGSARSYPILLSARDPERLRVAAARLLAVVDKNLAANGARGTIDGLRVPSVAALRAKLAELLDVSPSEIDDAEAFDSLGVDRGHRVALASWLESGFQIGSAQRAVDSVETLAQLSADLVSQVPVFEAAHDLGSLSIADIAWTLQVGREAMDARLAIEAADLDEFQAGLRAFLDGKIEHPGLHIGNANDHRATISVLSGDDEIRSLAESWIARGSLGRLLTLWVQGLDLDWESLAGPAAGRVVSLPCYPFARERYWIPNAGQLMSDTASRPEETDIARLATDMEALDAAIAAVVRASVAAFSGRTLADPFGRWCDALDVLLPATHAEPRDAAWAAWDRFKSQASPSLAAQITLAETMLRALPDILSGRRAAPAVMFPGGKLDLVEGVYTANPVAARFSAGVARAAAAWVADRLKVAPGASIRVLEIGAGTGATSAHVFAALAPFGKAIADYCYTDVSRAFLIKAEQRFKNDAPSLSTALFDVEKPPAEQGLAAGGFDLVIAANVLHATSDIGRTLRHVRETLAPGGALLLNETSRATLFTHVTFGLLDGWWRFTDAERRIPGTPSLSPDGWRRALEDAGFAWRSGSPDRELALGQQIIVAERPAAASAAREPRTSRGLRDVIRGAVAETLNMPLAAIAVETPFADYGLDSILGAELVERLRIVLGIRIEQTRLYDFGSVLRLEGYVASAFPDAAVPKIDVAVAATPPSPVEEATLVPAIARHDRREPIAVVGLSGRFARSPDVDTLWSHLLAGRDLVEPVTRFSTANGRRGSFIDSFDRFDSVFFGISGLEATYMDPQQRVFLEEAWKALEHGGHAGAAMEGRRCGVFVGCSAGDYQEVFRSQPPGQAFWGNTASLIPARIAYCLDLKGPAIAVDTACSSSLVALDLACRSLWSGECEMALAGGVFVQCTDRFFRYADAAGMLSPSGRCAAFGAEADGIVPGEAAAAVLLRPLSQAVADGDTIHGLIVASGTNQDGATNGITAPSAVSQERLMREVYASFGIDAAQIGYVEAHGTGTRLGDPIEYDALARVYSDAGALRGSCLLGSVKANLGHATTAAGITSVIKLLCALKDGIVPPALHVARTNPAIRFDDGPFRVNAEAERWPHADAPRRAAVSSFGFSGTNAHAVIEQAPPLDGVPDAGREYLIVLSARTPAQLRQQAERLAAHLGRTPGLALRDVAFTLLGGRRHLPHRLALVAKDVADAVAALAAWLAGDVSTVKTAVADAPFSGVLAGGASDASGMADRFLAGVTLDAEALFAGSGRRRVPLPVYPFAETRYWVDEVPLAKLSASAVHAADPVDVVSAPSDASGAGLASARSGERVKVKLAPLDAAMPHDAPAAHVSVQIEREIGADGVCTLALSQPWTAPLDMALADEVQRVSELADVRCVLLDVQDGALPVTREAARGFLQAVRDCAVPVVVGLPEVRAEHATLLGCDFDAPREDAVLLARAIARAPRLALVELKRHLRTEQSPTAPTRDVLEVSGTAEVAAFAGALRRIALASRAVTLDAFDDGVVLVRMEERSGRNTFTPNLMDGLCEAFDLIGRSAGFKAVVLTGFDGYFARGGTVEGLESLQRGETQFTDRRIYSLPLECPLPVIAAMQGHAIGAGWALGMFSDIALFAEDSVYHSNYLELGFTPGAGATLAFPYRLGDRLGREVLFSATPFKGRDLKARAPGLTVRPASEVLAAALRLAHGLAQRSREELIAAKAEASAPLIDALPRFLARELDMHRRTFVGNDDVLARIRTAFSSLPSAERVAVDEPAALPHRRRDEVRAAVVASLAEELMIDAAEIRDGSGFLDLGLDSILAVTWIRRLNSMFATELPATAVYANPSVGALVDRLAREAPLAEVARVPETREAPTSSAVAVASPVVAAALPPNASPASKRASQLSQNDRPAIAVIGMSGRFPQAPDLDTFWTNIRTKRDCITEVPRDRWDIATHYDPDPQAPGKSYCKWMGAISGVDRFDPGFFNITPREAELMDPQQRLFLQHAWHAIEDAAIDPTTLAGAACGVFVGAGPSGYADLITDRNAYSLLGAAGSILAARIAYLLDLTGPAVSLDTACSSSLVAIAQACNSLVLGDSDLALAGGACVLIGPSMFVDTSKVSMLSPGGRCFTFDRRANGFVPGEGVGVMLLKRLDDAVRDGDPIRAVIRGWGANQDGKTNGIAAPNPEAQARLIRGVHERYGIAPESVGLIECHGTGTALGDPIEIEGLAGAFAGSGAAEASCAIGSVKSNVGHLLASAGVAGAMKAVLALEHAELPPTAHVETLNPHLALSGTPFVVNTEARAWAAPASGVRRAGVSAFGFSGTNAHVVFEAAPGVASRPAANAGPWVLPISARSADRLSAYAQALADFVARKPDLDLGALAATFQRGRVALAVRRAIVFRDRAALLHALGRLAHDANSAMPHTGDPLDALARAWTAGEHVDWPGSDARRLSAPGYPFATERYWAEPVPAAPKAPVQLHRPARGDVRVAGEARVAIIGGGPTGIGVGRELNDAGIAFDLFEAEADFGGVWNGDGACGRTYASLHLISPKFNTQVQDYPMPDDYPAYPSHAQMLAYVRAYARASGLYERTRFNAPVTRLSPEGRGWRLASGDGFSRVYDLAVVANGLQRVPLYPVPAYPGSFDGETLHTRDYKSPDQIRGRRVLVIGGGNSGCDVAAEAVHHAASVIHSTRRGYHYQPKFIAGKPTPQWMMELGGKFATKAETMAYIAEVFRLAGYDGTDYGLPAPDHALDGAHPVMNSQVLHHIGHGNLTPKGDVARFAGHTVHFRDGSSKEVDTIIYATGYRRDFPFLDASLLDWKAGIPDLFLHSVPRNHDNLLFMGFINAAGGLGDGLKTQGLFVRDYARAYFGRTRGLSAFLSAKRVDAPDLGQDHFVQSYRHLWEADLWKLLAEMRKYRDMLTDARAADMDAAQ